MVEFFSIHQGQFMNQNKTLPYDQLDFKQYKGKNAIVTGGSRGIGSRIVEILVQNECNVTILATFTDQGIMDQYYYLLKILSREEVNRIHFETVDLTDLNCIRKFRETYLQMNDSLDYMFLAAGSKDNKQRTNYGVSKIIACNYLGHFTLVEEFLPSIIKQNQLCTVLAITCSSDSILERIENRIPSRDFFKEQVQFLEFADGLYLSKLYLTLYIRELATRLRAGNLQFIALNPSAPDYLDYQPRKNDSPRNIVQVASSSNIKSDWLHDENKDYILEQFNEKFDYSFTKRLLESSRKKVQEVYRQNS